MRWWRPWARLGAAVSAGVALGVFGLALPALAAPVIPESDPHPVVASSLVVDLKPAAEPSAAPSAAREAASLAQVVTQPRAKIGLQAGHWRAAEAPAPLNTQTGSSGRGKTEAQVNLPIAEAAAAVLRAAGFAVDVLPTVIPQGYRADAVVAIHADGGPSNRRGFFVDTSFRKATASAEASLARRLTEAYSSLGIPNVFRGTQASRYYYGYYRVDAQTPMVLIEGGFLTNPADQKVLIDQAESAGAQIARGIIAYFDSLTAAR